MQQSSNYSRRTWNPQDLSGDEIKVVQYCIVSVVPGIADNARVLVGPDVVAFGDDMTSEDFTAWIIAENACKKPGPTDRDDEHCYPPDDIAVCWDRKYLRVAFTVMGRFSRAEIHWKELQALSVARIANKMPPHRPCPGDTHHEAAVAATAVATSTEGES